MTPNEVFQSFEEDVIPIAQDDGPFPVCCIDYDDEFSKAMGYMRAVLQRNEFSGELTTMLVRIIV